MKGIAAVAVLLAVALAACSDVPGQRVDSGNPELTVERIGLIEGCRLYRVRDSYTAYVTLCGPERAPNGGSTTTGWTRCQPVGKGRCVMVRETRTSNVAVTDDR